jgi:lipid-A-disaccharide synthase
MGFSSLLRRSFSVRSRTVVDMGDKDGELRVFMVAGEVSGDSIASRLMASLKKLSPLPIRFSGVGG